jgi:hypothetical protein
MHRFVGAFILASFAGVSIGACSDSSSGGGYGYAYGSANSCSQYTTCGSCTPVQGCGWCFNTSGGACASDPDQCASANEFTWTWNADGCPGVDASVGAVDSGAPEAASMTTPEASTPEAATKTQDSAVATPDAPSEAASGSD